MTEESIFAEALEKGTPSERAAYLDEACAGDAVLRQRIETLLKSHEADDDFLGKPAIQRAAEEFAGQACAEDTQGELPVEDAGEALNFLAPSDKPEALGRLGHYEVQEVIGRGGMGIVLRAFDDKLHRVVAIKVMAGRLATNVTARRRFTREAQAAAAVCHDHIVTIHAVEEDSSPPYLVMHYVAGLSLQQRLDRDGPLDLHEILRIGMQTAAGLAAAHAQGLVHRDIKPANILLENGVERVKITDFGLARAATEASLTQSGMVAGTPQYMSPEQAQGVAIDQRTDLFSLGSVLYAMCTGRAPFRASGTMAVLKHVCEQTPTPIRETNSDIPDWLVAIIDKLHAKNPAQRYQSATEVAELLSRHLAHVQHPSVAPLPAPSPPAVGAAESARPRTVPHPGRRWAVAAAAVLLLLGGLSLTEATGVTNLRATVTRILTPDGTLVVETDDPAVKVTVEGDGDLVITGAGPQEVRLRAGSYRLRATKDGKPVTLDRDLVTISRGDKQIVRVRLEDKTAAAVVANAERGLFVVLGREGVPERKFDTLAEAARNAHEGDTIEIRGNGPFVTDPVTIHIALRIRAADGFRPALTVSESGARTALAVLDAHAPLVLEGVELQRIGGPPQGTAQGGLVVCRADSLHVANCRFLLDDPQPTQSGFCITSHSPRCFLRNSEFITRNGFSFQYVSRLPGQFVMDNCVGSTAAFKWEASPANARSVQLKHNTIIGTSLSMWFRDTFLAVEVAEPRIAFQSTGNVFGGPRLLAVSGIEPSRTMAALPQRLTWQEVDSLYPNQVLLTAQSGSLQAASLIQGEKALEEWRRLWKLPDGQVIVGVPGFRGDIRSKLAAAPAEITPEDFRLHADSPGYRAGKDGKDLGADVDLVGPGPAYERWKKTPEYQQWLKDTGRLRAETSQAEPGAFVVMGSNGVAERKFDTLAEAARNARDGDTIEIRGNGPFVIDPVTIRMALRIRAAAGFRPVLRLSERGALTRLAALEAYAPLVLEGLELQRFAGPPGGSSHGGIVQGHGNSLHVANCRFLLDVLLPTQSGHCIFSHSPRCILRNSEFITRNGFSFHYVSRLPGQFVMDNCVGSTGVFTWDASPADARSVQLRHNTIIAASLVMTFRDAFLAGEDTEPRIAVQNTGNVFGGTLLLHVEGIEPARTMATLPRRLTWQEVESLYPSQTLLMARSSPPLVPLIQGEKALDEWRRLWNLTDGQVILGVPRFRGDFRSKLAANPAEVTPDDFRLSAGSPGYRAGKDGKDLGADVDLVGPGPAYDRWKKTPEYQQWLKDAKYVK